MFNKKKEIKSKVKEIQEAITKLQEQLNSLKETEEKEEAKSSNDWHEKFLGCMSKLDTLLDHSIDDIAKYIKDEGLFQNLKVTPKMKATSIVNGLKLYVILSIFKTSEVAMEVLFCFPTFYYFIDSDELDIIEKTIGFKDIDDLIVDARRIPNFSWDCLNEMNNMFYNMSSTTNTIETRHGLAQRKECKFTFKNVFDEDFNNSKLQLHFQQIRLNRVSVIQSNRGFTIELVEGEKVTKLGEYCPGLKISLFSFFNALLARMIAKRNGEEH